MKLEHEDQLREIRDRLARMQASVDGFSGRVSGADGEPWMVVGSFATVTLAGTGKSPKEAWERFWDAFGKLRSKVDALVVHRPLGFYDEPQTSRACYVCTAPGGELIDGPHTYMGNCGRRRASSG